MASWLLWTVVAACPLKDHRRPAIWQRFALDRTDVAMLLAIRHDHAEFICIALDRLLTSIDRAAIEHRNSRQVTSRLLGHQRENLRIDRLPQWQWPRGPGAGQLLLAPDRQLFGTPRAPSGHYGQLETPSGVTFHRRFCSAPAHPLPNCNRVFDGFVNECPAVRCDTAP